MVGEGSVGVMGDAKTGSAGQLTESEYARLPPENRAVLEWLREYMSEPLSDEEKAYWREVREFVDGHPFTFRQEASS